MGDIIQSAWGIVYYLDSSGEPRYLLIKRHALSGKIERVSPKGKVQPGEAVETTALREVSEETWIPIAQLRLKQMIWTTQLRNLENIKGQMDKDVTYFLMEFVGNPNIVAIDQKEWYVWIHKWANMQEVLGLIYYQDIRELIRKSYLIVKQDQKNASVKKQFIERLT